MCVRKASDKRNGFDRWTANRVSQAKQIPMVETDDQSVAIFHSASVSVLTRTKKKTDRA